MSGKPKQEPENAARRTFPAARRTSPNYASRGETMKAAARIMDERAEVFRRLAGA